jgi:hypothetical protein
MLHRPASQDRHRSDAERKARHRDRQRRGVVCPRGIEVSAVGLDFLIRTQWLAEGDAANLFEIGRAVTALIEDSGPAKAPPLAKPLTAGLSCLPASRGSHWGSPREAKARQHASHSPMLARR